MTFAKADNQPISGEASRQNYSRNLHRANGCIELLLQELKASLEESRIEMRARVAREQQMETLLHHAIADYTSIMSRSTHNLNELQSYLPIDFRGLSGKFCQRPPPYYWAPCDEYANEFTVTGTEQETVTKLDDYQDAGWVIPVLGSLQMFPGAVYMWTLVIHRKAPHRPQMQFGVHGPGHEKPWRLITTSRCSTSSDDEPWIGRSQGDRLIKENDSIHVIVDLRGLHVEQPNVMVYGKLSYAINDGEYELAFNNLPLLNSPLHPVVSCGGAGCEIRVEASTR